MRIVIRCDSSKSIGYGHLRRCLSLAALLNKDHEIWFICQSETCKEISSQDTLIRGCVEIKTERCELLNEVNTDALRDDKEYDEIQDARTCIEALRTQRITNIDWVIVDHYGLGYKWEKIMKGELRRTGKTKVMVIDDLANRRHDCELLLDQNYYGEAQSSRYKGIVPEGCKLFVGPHYALLSSEYGCLSKQIRQRDSLNRVLVFFGSGESEKLIELTMKALMEVELRSLEVDVVLKENSRVRNVVEEVSAERGGVRIHYKLKTLAPLVVNSDLAIGAGGIHTYERIALELPAIVFETAINQREALEYLFENEAIVRGNRDSLGSIIGYVRDNYNSIADKVRKVKATIECDMEGVPRLVRELEGD